MYDGSSPQAALIQASNGDLYGTTSLGGTGIDSEVCGDTPGCGTIFQISPNGAFTTLHTFCSETPCTEGHNPAAGLVQASDGYLYGTTETGGIAPYTQDCYSGGGAACGTISKISLSGTLTTLYTFCSQSGCTDGGIPYAGLIQATDGNLYGTTSAGGSTVGCEKGCGTLFKVTLSGTLTTLYSFCPESPCVDGKEPEAGLVQATNGRFYGTTIIGGAFGTASNSLGSGTVFNLSAGLRPFVETQPNYGEVGSSVRILGTNLTGATSVTFNGAAAVFQALSATEIIATAPAGASSGKVQVLTPNGTLSSNGSFRVLQ